MNQHHQNHLRTLRRGLNRAVATLKEGRRLIIHSGWSHGRAFALSRDSAGSPIWPDAPELFFFYPAPLEKATPFWRSEESLLPEGLTEAADFFWPGPLVIAVRCSTTRRKVHLACPWHPLLRELLARHGPCLWTPLSGDEQERLAVLRRQREVENFDDEQALIWPEREVELAPSFFDASTRPWRWMESGFVGHDELADRIAEPFLLSADRAFPARQLRSQVPGYKIVVLEAADGTELPSLVERFRQGIGPEWSIRVYLDEGTAHAHFPDDRSVRVYGEMSDPERVRRRLEAMLERQRRRSGKRVLLIAVTELPPSADSLKADLQKLTDRWMRVPAGGGLELDEFAS